MGKKRLWTCLLALAVSAALAGLYPALRGYVTGEESALPPGAAHVRRQLVTVWLAGDLPGAGEWLRRRAAAYGRVQPGVSVWVRAVGSADLSALAAGGEGAPDLIAFTPEAAVLPESVTEWAALCLSGYVLAVRTAEAAATPPPRSLFGVTPSPDPARTPSPAGEPVWPGQMLADDGFGALALSAMGAPTGAELDSASNVLRRFLAGETEGAVLTAAQARAAGAQGVGCRVAAASPATDLVLYGGLTPGAGEAASGFWRYLQGEESRRALAEGGLLPPGGGPRLYGEGEPALSALEGALAEGVLAPPFRWAAERRDALATAQALYRSGQYGREWEKLLR